MAVIIAGAGIGGLTLALALHRRSIPCRVYEAAPELRPLGVGINLLPHATAVLGALGVLPALERVAVTTYQAAYYNRFGQRILAEPLGRRAGYAHPQLSIHRGDLHMVLLAAVRDRLGAEAVVTGHRLVAAEDGADAAIAHFVDGTTGATLPPVTGQVVIGADGIRSALRRQLFPDDGPLVYSGVTMWRGTTVMAPILEGPSMVRAGWLAQGKLVAYPIREHADGSVLMNWLAEVEVPQAVESDWSREGRLEDFLPHFADWRFDWLDVPAMMRAAGQVLEYPMVDKDPLPRWSFGRRTLLGDAAHPMYPRGSNGAGQSILDARALADCLAAAPGDAPAALRAYEAERLGPTSQVVLSNRSMPPDIVIKEVWERTGDKPFGRIEEVISEAELLALVERYKRVAGYSKSTLAS
jgi:2-polyprenyl-6-methoxyphenol hydroxylase-like FAD-dependent oxidoreductase